LSVRSGIAPALPEEFNLDETQLELLPAVSGLPVRRPGRDPVLIGCLILVGIALRAPTLNRAYWVDEGISVGIASHRLSQIPGLLRLDGSPPLYYALLHPWLRVFGSTELSVHSFSLLISVAVIPVAWWSARRLFGPAAGWCAAVLATTNPFLAWYGTESRMYPLACGLALLGVALAVRATRDRRVADAVWATMVFGLLVYTHNWGLYLVVATAAVIAVHAIRHRDGREFLVVAGAAGALGLLYLPWLPFFVDQAGNTAAPWAVPPSVGDLFADPASVLGGTLGALIGPLFVAGVLVCLVKLPAGHRRLALAILAISGIAVTEGWIAAQIEPSWASRYLAIALGPALLALAGLLGTTRKGRRVVVTAAVLLTAWSVVGSLIPDANARFAKSNVAAVVGVAAEVLRPGDLVVVTQTEQLAVVAHYAPAGLHFATPLGKVTDPYVVDWRHLTSRLERADPCGTLAPALAALPLGAHVFVVNPLKPIGASGSRWSRAVKHQVDLINHLLFQDHGLHPMKSFNPAAVPKPFSPVVGLLFTKTTGTTACS
jgi:mannosyltransferase